MLRADGLYAAGAWVLAQGIAQLAPVARLPDWLAHWFLVAAIVGFPFWLAFASTAYAQGRLAVGRQQLPAAELYRNTIATDPLRTNFYASLASILLGQGQLDAAEQATRKALA